MTVCKSEDDFVRELQDDRRTAVWVAELSNGERIYMDDGRPDASPSQAWLRLAHYVSAERLDMVKLGVKFRSHIKDNILPARADGYYFCKQVVGYLTSRNTLGFYLFGALQNQELRVQKWSVPELVLVEEGRRDPDKAGHCLIINPHGQTKEYLGIQAAGPILSPGQRSSV